MNYIYIYVSTKQIIKAEKERRLITFLRNRSLSFAHQILDSKIFKNLKKYIYVYGLKIFSEFWKTFSFSFLDDRENKNKNKNLFAVPLDSRLLYRLIVYQVTMGLIGFPFHELFFFWLIFSWTYLFKLYRGVACHNFRFQKRKEKRIP